MSASRQRPGNHLLPTLFDRLCDDAPNQKRDHGISVSPVQIKEIIRRDLSFLLNTVSHEDDIDAARYPYAAASVLNYGLPPLAGSFLYEHKWDDIRRAILRTITRFEPRLKASTLQIIPLQDERRQSGHNTLQFEIRGEILTQPYPTAFRVRSALDVNLQQPVMYEGLEPDQGLLPLAWNVFHGHNLLHEYFACPERFYFFTPTGLSAGLQKIDGGVAEIVILLNRLPPDWLIHQTNAAQFSLFCTPVINLFPRVTARIDVTHSTTEQHLVVDRTHPLDYEVFSVQEVEGLETDTTRKMAFRPLYHTRNNDEGNHGRYFSLRREPRRLSENARRYGTRTPYTGSEVFLSLVDQYEAPYPENLRHITITAMVTNRDLPCLIARNGRDDLTVDAAIPVAGVGLIRPPRSPQPPLAEREMAWRLIRQLSFNYLPLADLDHRTGGQALRDLLNLFIPAHDSPQSRQVRSLIGCKTTPVTRRLPGSGLLVYGRGVSCELTVDEEGFSGISPYLFGLVLEHYIARHVSINTFSQMTLHSMQRGKIMTWPVRAGQRGSV